MCGPHFGSKRDMSEGEPLKVGLEQKATEFTQAGAKIYAKA